MFKKYSRLICSGKSKFYLLYLTLGLLLLAAQGCSLHSGETQEPVKSGKQKTPRGSKPYTIRGKTYYPLLSANGYSENGIASWYGSDFHGKQTANGERYDMYGMTAAHKLLPFGTTLKVTNKDNGKSIIVRINDRGPFVANRVIDLTRTGAEKIGMIARGTAPVLLETVGAVKGLEGGDLKGNFYVQVGAFANRSNADKLAARLKAEADGARVYYAESVGFFRVQAGPYQSLAHAEKAADSLAPAYPNNFVVAE